MNEYGREVRIPIPAKYLPPILSRMAELKEEHGSEPKIGKVVWQFARKAIEEQLDLADPVQSRQDELLTFERELHARELSLAQAHHTLILERATLARDLEELKELRERLTIVSQERERAQARAERAEHALRELEAARKGGVLVPDWVLVAAAGLLAYGGYELYSQHKRAHNAEGLAFGMYSKGLEDGAEKKLCNWLQREDCPLPKELRHQLLDLLPDPDNTIAAENLKTT